MILGLEDPNGTDPLRALTSTGTHRPAERMVEIVKEVEPEYTLADFLTGFVRANLYPVGNPAVGPGARDMDSRMADWAILLARHYHCETIICLGLRVGEAIRSVETYGIEVIQIPHPLGRNRIYKDTRKRRKIARQLFLLTGEAS